MQSEEHHKQQKSSSSEEHHSTTQGGQGSGVGSGITSGNTGLTGQGTQGLTGQGHTGSQGVTNQGVQGGNYGNTGLTGTQGHTGSQGLTGQGAQGGNYGSTGNVGHQNTGTHATPGVQGGSLNTPHSGGATHETTKNPGTAHMSGGQKLAAAIPGTQANKEKKAINAEAKQEPAGDPMDDAELEQFALQIASYIAPVPPGHPAPISDQPRSLEDVINSYASPGGRLPRDE